jgi:hypothetical protein
MAFDISSFQRWSVGNLVDNRTRGIFAEWMVGQALGCIASQELREEWAPFDLHYGTVRVEVKASGYSQTWNPDEPTTPRFGIKGVCWAWEEWKEGYTPPEDWVGKERRSGFWTYHKNPVRQSDVYVFCLHESLPATNKNVADPNSWKFWVIPTETLNSELGEQASLGIAALNRLAPPVTWEEIKTTIDAFNL